MTRTNGVLRKLPCFCVLTMLSICMTVASAQSGPGYPSGPGTTETTYTTYPTISVGGGTLGFTQTTTTPSNCYSSCVGSVVESSFTFTYDGTVYPLNAGQVTALNGNVPNLPKGPQPANLPISLPTGLPISCIDYDASSSTWGPASAGTAVVGSDCPVQGLLYPKYVVVGVTYAPPGPSSSVQYTGTTSVGNTSTISSSFSNDAGFSVSIKSATGLSGFGPKGSLTVTETTDYTQGSSSSTTATLSKQTSLAYKTMGTGNAFSPVNSDYDTIWLWLDPIVVLTVTPSTSSTPVGIQWNGYGFDTDDPSGTQQPDVYPVLVGWLNGDFGSNPSINAILARGWQSTANGYLWPAGEGPGLTGIGNPVAGTDVANILAADPLTNSSYTLPSTGPSTTSDGRFTLMEGSNTPNPIPYEQSGPGNGGGITTSYNTTQTNAQSVSQGTSNSTKQVFSVQEVFGGSVWVGSLTLTLKESDTLTWTNSTLSTLNTTTTLANALSITGPGCPAAPPGPCTPEYAGPGKFLVYQDNQFGTFMFYPSN